MCDEHVCFYWRQVLVILVARHSAVMICKIHLSNHMRRIYLNQYSVGLSHLTWPQCNWFTKMIKWYQLKSTAITDWVSVCATEACWVMVVSLMIGYGQWLFHSPCRCVAKSCRVRVAMPLLPRPDGYELLLTPVVPFWLLRYIENSRKYRETNC